MFVKLPASAKHLACGNDKGAATQEKNLMTRGLNLEWEPPAGLTGNISFLATVVKNETTFWVKIQSPELYKREMPSQSSQPAPTATKQALLTTSIAKSSPTGANPSSKATQFPNNVALIFFIGLLMAIWH